LNGGVDGRDEPQEAVTAVTASFTLRPPWQVVPVEVRRAVECRIGALVVASHDVRGGMTPGPAVALTLGNGDRVFVKAISRAVSAGSYRLYQQEAVVLRRLPPDAPAAALLDVVETGDWIALVIELIPGPAPPSKRWHTRAPQLPPSLLRPAYPQSGTVCPTLTAGTSYALTHAT
jgi:hypothetical protein